MSRVNDRTTRLAGVPDPGTGNLSEETRRPAAGEDLTVLIDVSSALIGEAAFMAEARKDGPR
jgi:hypothetical protein